MTSAFTLVELLVVVAVAVVLTAVALPVYQTAQLSASQAVAASALHQVSAAGQMCLADNRKVYRPFRSDTAAGTTYWFGYETAADSALPERQCTIDYDHAALCAFGRQLGVRFATARHGGHPPNGDVAQLPPDVLR